MIEMTEALEEDRFAEVVRCTETEDERNLVVEVGSEVSFASCTGRRLLWSLVRVETIFFFLFFFWFFFLW